MTVCIWCKSSDNPASEEHIFPDALGCPDALRFTNGEVCRPCNNGNGRLDRALIAQLEPFSFMAGVPRKHGRPPVIEHRKNLWADSASGEPTISINTTRQPIRDEERMIGPVSRSPWTVASTSETVEDQGKVSLSFTFVGGRNFVRGLHKIALELLAFHRGTEIVLTDRYDPIRAFVVQDQGARQIIYGMAGSEYVNHDFPPLVYPDERFALAFRIAHFHFWVDLSPDHSLIGPATDELRRTVGQADWVLHPPKL